MFIMVKSKFKLLNLLIWKPVVLHVIYVAVLVALVKDIFFRIEYLSIWCSGFLSLLFVFNTKKRLENSLLYLYGVLCLILFCRMISVSSTCTLYLYSINSYWNVRYKHVQRSLQLPYIVNVLLKQNIDGGRKQINLTLSRINRYCTITYHSRV